MKTVSYELASNKDVEQVKVYLYNLCLGDLQEDIYDAIKYCMDIKQIRRNIANDKGLEVRVFMKIKKAIDKATSYNEIEDHLVYMNILIDSYFKPLLEYKYKLLNYIVEYTGFNIDTYCILRHLIKYNRKTIKEFIYCLAKRLNYSDDKYYYILCNILLLEKEYKQVYNYLSYVVIDQQLVKYLPALYNFSPRKYRKYVKIDERGLELVIM